jgi:predicted transcriptional regulator
LDEQLDQRLSHQNAATNRPPQAARRDALQSRVKLIRRRFNADAPRLGVDIVAEGDVR